VFAGTEVADAVSAGTVEAAALSAGVVSVGVVSVGKLPAGKELTGAVLANTWLLLNPEDTLAEYVGTGRRCPSPAALL
jgi:hypothetical protein